MKKSDFYYNLPEELIAQTPRYPQRSFSFNGSGSGKRSDYPPPFL